MLSLNQTFEESRPIRVLVVPIGNNSLFETHFDIVSRRRDIPMFDLNRPSDWKQQTCPFKNFNWNSGSMLFEYLRYDRGANGPSDLDYYQASRRVLVVIGVINFPEFKIESLDVDMDYYSRRYPHVILRRYFIFNYAFDATSSRMPPLPSKHDDPYAIVVFPPDGLCEGGSMIDVHMREVMATMSVRLFLALEVQMTVCDDVRQKSNNNMPPHLILATKYDDLDKEAATESKRKKRLPSRLRKWMGDLCLQVCSPLDALEHYTAAISECRSYSDYMWLAGALEGFCISVLLLVKLQIPFDEVLARDLKPYLASGLTPDIAVIKLVEDRAVEALTMYSKCVALCGLEVEGTLRIARMLETASIPEKEQKVMEFIMRAASIPGLNNQQQFETILEGSFICSRLGLRRKYAFLLYVAAMLSAECENTEVANSLARCACKQYGVSFGDPWNPDALDMHVSSPHLSWANMRRVLFAHSANFSKENGDITEATKSIAALLRLTGEMEAKRLKYRQLWIPAILPASSEVIDSLAQGNSSPAISSADLSPEMDASFAISSTKSLRLPPGALDEYDAKRSMTMDRPQSDGAMRLLTSKSSKSVASPTTDLSMRMLNEDMRGSSINRALSTLHQSAATAKSQLAASLTTMSESHHSRDSDSQHVDANGEAARALIDVLKGSRGLISVPKLLPFVSSLAASSYVKKRHRSIKQVPIPVSTTAFDRDLIYPPNYGNIAISGTSSTPSYRPLLSISVNDAQGVVSSDGILLLQDPTNRLGVTVEEQEQSMVVFNAFSKLIEPGTTLLLAGLPKLVSCKCLPLPEMQRPYTMSAATSGEVMTSKGALFYDPFASKRSKSTPLQESKHYWMVDVLSTLEIVLSNPLAVPLVLQDVRGLLEGAAHKITPIPILVIPPYTTEFKTILHVTPLAPGDMKVKGIRYIVNNATYDMMVDENGNGVSMVPSEISPVWSYPRRAKTTPKESKQVVETVVASPLATLNADASWMSMEQLTGEGALDIRGCLPGAVLNMFGGEVRRESIRLENVSDKKVADLRIAAQLYVQEAEKRKVLATVDIRPFTMHSSVPSLTTPDAFINLVNYDDVASKLPLPPGGVLMLEVELNCPATSYSASASNQICSAMLQLDVDYITSGALLINGCGTERMSPPSPYDDGKCGDIELKHRRSSELNQPPAIVDTLYYKKSVIRTQMNIYPSVRFTNLTIPTPVSLSCEHLLSSAALKPMLERFLCYRELLEVVNLLPTSSDRLLTVEVCNDSASDIYIHRNNISCDFNHIFPHLSNSSLLIPSSQRANIVTRISSATLLSKLRQPDMLTDFIGRELLAMTWTTKNQLRKGIVPLALEMSSMDTKKYVLSTTEQAGGNASFLSASSLSPLISPFDMILTFGERQRIMIEHRTGSDAVTEHSPLQHGVFYNLRLELSSCLERLHFNKILCSKDAYKLETKIAIFSYAHILQRMKIDSVDLVPCDSIIVTGRHTSIREMQCVESNLTADHGLTVCFPCTGMYVIAVVARFCNQDISPWWTFGVPTVITVQ